MSNLTTELHEELDAFDPKWKERYPSISVAAREAGVLVLYWRWLNTPDGAKYTSATAGVPDRVGESRREVEAYRAPSSLPFGYDNIGELPESAWGQA